MTQDLRNPSDPAADLNTVCSNVTRNGLGRLTVKKSFLRNGNREKRWRYAKKIKKLKIKKKEE